MNFLSFDVPLPFKALFDYVSYSCLSFCLSLYHLQLSIYLSISPLIAVYRVYGVYRVYRSINTIYTSVSVVWCTSSPLQLYFILFLSLLFIDVYLSVYFSLIQNCQSSLLVYNIFLSLSLPCLSFYLSVYIYFSMLIYPYISTSLCLSTYIYVCMCLRYPPIYLFHGLLGFLLVREVSAPRP